MIDIFWDDYQVPHIFAESAPDLFYALAWAQMRNHGALILRLYGQARGRAAEYWGEEHRRSDRWVQSMEIPERARCWYEAQNPDFRRYLDAFAAGVNAAADAHADRIGDDPMVVLPVDAVDVLAHAQRVVSFAFVVDPVIQPVDPRRRPGSNAWAVAPSHSTTGHAMLLANPHLPWSDLFLWFEAHLNAPGVNTYGVALVGFPTLAIAFNDFLGWSHTLSAYNGVTVYELELAPGGYRLDGDVLPFSVGKKTLKVRQRDGSLCEESLTLLHSIHGPVVAERGGKAFALRIAGLDRPGALEQWWKMGLATNLPEFEAALERLQIPAFTVIYADRDGHILHLFNGQVPVRSGGNAEHWAGIVSGTVSENLWTETHPYGDLPRIVDPPSGWLQNANDPPWTTTFPAVLRPGEYPPYMAPRGPMSLRAQRSARMLMEHEKLSFEELVACKFSTRVELADRVVDDLARAAARSGDPAAQRAAALLRAWDRKADPESRGAVLFAVWVREVGFDRLFAVPWDEHFPLATPRGLADPEAAVSALVRAAHAVESSYGTLDIEWGAVFQLRTGEAALPASGADAPLGVFQELWFAPAEDGRFVATGGDCFIAVVEFSDPVRAMVLTVYGNAFLPFAPEAGEQLKLFARKQLRPAWRTRQEILHHLAAHERCSYSPA